MTECISPNSIFVNATSLMHSHLWEHNPGEKGGCLLSTLNQRWRIAAQGWLAGCFCPSSFIRAQPHPFIYMASVPPSALQQLTGDNMVHKAENIYYAAHYRAFSPCLMYDSILYTYLFSHLFIYNHTTFKNPNFQKLSFDTVAVDPWTITYQVGTLEFSG